MNKTILAAVVLIAAAFAGVMIVGDDADADTPASYTITYKGELGIVTQTGVDTIGLKGPDDVSSIIEYDHQVYKFIGWKTESANPVVYKFVTGASGEEGPSISLSENMTLIPAYELKGDAKVVFFKLDDTTFMVKTAESKVNFGSTADDVKALLAAIKVKEDAGFKFDGYFTQGSESAKAEVGADNIMTVTDRATYDVKMHMAYEVKYVVEGTTILTVEDAVTIKLNPVKDIPVAPSKANFGFVAWADETGKEIITYTVDGGYKAVPADSELVFTADTILYAKFVPANMTVTFEVGEFKSTQTVLYGEKAMKPELPAGYVAWMFEDKEFDFNTPITENITIVALAEEPATIYDVTFEIEGKAPVVQKSDSMVLPDTTRAGYDFKGWVVKGASQYVDPTTFEITENITFVAVYEISKVAEYTVTFVNGDEVIDTVKVISGAVVEKIDAPEGMFWLFDFETAITKDITVEAKPLTVAVQFAVGEKVYNAYTQVIAYGEKIDVTKLTDFIFPDGYDSWNYDFNEPVTADMTVYAKAIPEPEKEPKFYETPMGQCVIIIAVFIVGLVFFGVFTGRIELPKFKVSRVSKDEVVEQVQEEKKP